MTTTTSRLGHVRELCPTAFVPPKDPAAEAQASLEAFADSPFYEDRFAVWSMLTPNAMKRRYSRDVERQRNESALAAIARRVD
jgi:hypothetical protein